MALPDDVREMMLNSPALPPPPGVVPNFIDPLNIKSQLVIINIVFFILGTIAVAIRVYAKCFVAKRLAFDDYLIGFAWLYYATAFQVVVHIHSNMKAAGIHQYNLLLKDLIPFLYYLKIAETNYGILVMLIKVAIIFQCSRLLAPGGVCNATYWIFQVLLYGHILFYVISLLFKTFLCNPRAKAWDPTIQGGHCLDAKALAIATGAINVASDLIMVIIPQMIIWRLNMSVKKKYAVSTVFLIGLFACASAATWMYYSIRLIKNMDFTWGVAKVGIWTSVEICCGFWVACTPAFPIIFKHEPFCATMRTPFVFFLRLRTSASSKLRSERLGSIDAPPSKPKHDPIVTDIEFQELVRGPDGHLRTIDSFDAENAEHRNLGK